MLKGILDGYRLRRPVRDDFVIVDTAGEFVQPPTIAAKVVFEHAQIETSQIPHRLCSKFRQLLSRNFADARQASDRQWQEKRIYVLGLVTKSPSGLRQSEASFAKNLLGATPAEAVRFNSWRICSRIVRATRVAVGKPVLFSVTSR